MSDERREAPVWLAALAASVPAEAGTHTEPRVVRGEQPTRPPGPVQFANFIRGGFVKLIQTAAIALFIAVAASAQVVETAHLKVTGGPNAGTYDSSSAHGGCSYGLSGPGSWGN